MTDVTVPGENTDGTYSRREVNSFIKHALEKAGEINTHYTQLFEGTAEKAAVLPIIEKKAQEILAEYEKAQTLNSENSAKLTELHTKLDEVRNYHKELLDGDDSIKADIAESQEKITEFYIYLFGGTETGGQDSKVKAAIESILKFQDDLNKEGGLVKTIEAATATIMKTYTDLYDLDEKGESKINKLNADIENITKFRSRVDKELVPFLEETRKDIIAKRKDVTALLLDTTGGSLIKGFLKSKKEYQQEPEYLIVEDNSVLIMLGVLGINIFRYISIKLGVLLNYILFILPLLLSVGILMRPELISLLFGTSSSEFSVSKLLAELNFFGRTTLSLPLWWISWFGQRSIFQNRRLAEEYNHKAQVATMYLNFSSRDTKGMYPISDKARELLDEKLIEVITRHPGKVYGKDATILDKLVRIFEVKTGLQNSLINSATKAITNEAK